MSIDAGVEIERKWSPGDESAFPPLPATTAKQIGIFNDCNNVEVAASRSIQNAGTFANAALDVIAPVWRFKVSIPLIKKQLLGITLPGNPSVSVDIAMACFIEPRTDDGPLNFIADSKVCAICPDDMPRYNPTRQECEEECSDDVMPFFQQGYAGVLGFSAGDPDVQQEIASLRDKLSRRHTSRE